MECVAVAFAEDRIGMVQLMTRGRNTLRSMRHTAALRLRPRGRSSPRPQTALAALRHVSPDRLLASPTSRHFPLVPFVAAAQVLHVPVLNGAMPKDRDLALT